MLEVRGFAILADEMEILQTIREQVSIQQGREILRKIKRSGNNIMVCCPNHSNGQERKPSCGISLVAKKVGNKIHPAGTAHCFACGYVGTFPQFVSTCFGYDDDGSFGEQWLIENFVSGETTERPSLIGSMGAREALPFFQTQKTVQYVSEHELASYRYYHPYMWQRKLTPEIVEKYDVGYQKDFVLKTKNDDGTEKCWPPVECLTFPVRDINGNCLFVSRRAIYNKNFYLPLDIDKPVYGLYELPKGCKDVVICESVINALTCVAYGVPAVALFGTGNALQYQQLNEMPVRHFILGLDPDKAGFKGAYKLRKNLPSKFFTKLVIPRGKDINDLSREEFLRLQEVRV